MDPRLKVVCAIYGCGWNRYWRNIPKYGPAEKVPGPTEADLIWNGGMEPEAYPPYIHCPVLFLSASNDNHGNMDRAYDTLARLPANVERRQAFTPRFCHHIGADFDQNLPLWMDRWLKGGPPWPQSPAARVSLGADGVPLLTVTADKPQEVEGVAVYYAVENPRTVSRNWRNAAVTRAGEGWQAALPVMNPDKDLFAFANVRYRSGIHLSSNEEVVVPARLGPAKATDQASTVLYDGSDGTGMWASGSPCTDPVPFGQVPVPIRSARGPGGRLGFTVNPYATPMTYQPGDPKWQAPAGARLSFDIATTTGETLTVTVDENYFWPGAKSYEAEVVIEGRSGWQTITLPAGNFKEKRQGAALDEFHHCDRLQLTGPWKDKQHRLQQFPLGEAMTAGVGRCSVSLTAIWAVLAAPCKLRASKTAVVAGCSPVEVAMCRDDAPWPPDNRGGLVQFCPSFDSRRRASKLSCSPSRAFRTASVRTVMLRSYITRSTGNGVPSLSPWACE